MFRFANPDFLYLLFIVPVLIIFFIGSFINRRKNIKKFGNPELVKQLMPDASKYRPHVKFYLLMGAIILLILIMARPQFGSKLNKTKRKGIEVMIALDISNSMLSEDVSPNRLEKAKQILSNMIDGLSDDKVGLVVFAGDAFVQLPITSDYVSAKMFMSSITPALIQQQGTAIGSAIDLCLKSFPPKEGVNRAIILITDGENHEDDAIEAAKAAHTKGCIVHVIGMGRPDGGPIPIPGTTSFKKDKNGNVVVSRLNEQMCQQIAQAGNGVYVRADNTNSAQKIVTKQLDKMATTEIESKVYSDYEEQFQTLAWIALFLLVLDFFILERKNKLLKKVHFFD
jgi:Ca-activated chloride channel family protein